MECLHITKLGIAERHSRELHELAQAKLIRAYLKWRGGIAANLWSYAVRITTLVIFLVTIFVHVSNFF
jgi:hypothetical protein